VAAAARGWAHRQIGDPHLVGARSFEPTRRTRLTSQDGALQATALKIVTDSALGNTNAVTGEQNGADLGGRAGESLEVKRLLRRGAGIAALAMGLALLRRVRGPGAGRPERNSGYQRQQDLTPPAATALRVWGVRRVPPPDVTPPAHLCPPSRRRGAVSLMSTRALISSNILARESRAPVIFPASQLGWGAVGTAVRVAGSTEGSQFGYGIRHERMTRVVIVRASRTSDSDRQRLR
jgi:hypothetical protein